MRWDATRLVYYRDATSNHAIDVRDDEQRVNLNTLWSALATAHRMSAVGLPKMTAVELDILRWQLSRGHSRDGYSWCAVCGPPGGFEVDAS